MKKLICLSCEVSLLCLGAPAVLLVWHCQECERYFFVRPGTSRICGPQSLFSLPDKVAKRCRLFPPGRRVRGEWRSCELHR